MWTTDYRAETDAAPDAVWEALRALHSGIPLGPDSDSFELRGPFAVGTRLIVTPQGQQPMESIVIELEPGAVYADRTVFGELQLTFRHRIQAASDAGTVESGTAESATVVTHTLEIDGPGWEQLGPEIGPQISADFPVAMDELLAAAQRGVRV